MITVHTARNSGDFGTYGRSTRSSALEREIRARLRASGYLALGDLACEVRAGVACLEGRLRSYHLKQVAQAVALGVDGIGRVENRIKVSPVKGVTERWRFRGPHAIAPDRPRD